MVFPTITTISRNWPEKIKEVKKLELKEVCFFPTCLKEKDRKKVYQLIKSTKIKKIPLVHLREDMKPEELDYFIRNYKTQAFTIHSQSEYPLIYDYSKYKSIIFIENVFNPLDEKEIKNFGGISLDISHLENDRLLHKEKFKKDMKVIKKYPIGCNHVSAVKKLLKLEGKAKEREPRYTNHYFEDFSDFDYLKKYSKNYFSDIIAIELENSIKEQLLAKKYIIDMLNK